MNMILNTTRKVLLFPEPEATGGGEVFDMTKAVMDEYERKPWEEAEKQDNESGGGDATDDLLKDLTGGEEPKQDDESGGGENATDEDPFDFTKEKQPEEDKTGDDGAYELELGDSFGGSDEVRSMITGHAKELGLPADKAGAFVSAVCESLKAGLTEQRKQGYTELKNEWGRNAEANFDGTKRVLNDMLKAGVIKAEQVDDFKSPAVFRAINYLRSRLGEQGTKGMRSTADAGKARELKDILENPDNAMAKILMNPMHPQYASTAKYVNGLAGMAIY